MFVDSLTKDFYGVVIDAGSSGSRIHIFKWQNPNYPDDESTIPNMLHSVPQIYQSPEWTHKITPGLSSYEHKADKAFSDHVKPLLEFAEEIIPKEKLRDTPVFIQATAGMRLLPDKKREKILKNLCTGINKYNKFLLQDCNSQIEVIDGEMEGIYGWLGLNYLSGHFNNYELTEANHFSFGFMDMGGASAQIAFVPSDPAEIKKHRDDIATVYLKSINGDVQAWNVFVSTWLGFGANQARKRYLAQLINALPENTNDYDDDDLTTRKITDPCMPSGCERKFEFKGKKFSAIGSGNFEQCSKSIYPLLLKNLPCEDEPCLFNGVHTPKIDFEKDRFVGISEYWYTPNDVFKLGGPYDYKKFSKSVEEFCNTDWQTIKKNSDSGEYNSTPVEFLADTCFKSNWILNILHEGFNMPYERTNNLSLEDNTPDHPTFQSLGSLQDIELSWTLGKILLYASGGVTAGSRSVHVGVEPSEIQAKISGKSFILGSLPLSTSSNLFKSENLWSFFTIMILIVFLLYFSFWKRTLLRHFQLHKLNHLINLIKMKVAKFRNSHAMFEPLSQLEEGMFPPDDGNRDNLNNFKMGSKSMSNLRRDISRQEIGRPMSSTSSTANSPVVSPLSQRNSSSQSSKKLKTAFSLADFSKFDH
ncbi:hypothetical protein KAFR_0L00600 [Kazachstania africana CBS 2517]|uniref:Golgi apyrase n=1 Tax=Kazachstania africana (strain ATCC 22294 / BCRC 22015 / CBS 2517 / CECT 1963 / NBRC 1671 / NRRL Y-8276) TaxID=1071382 RepID=H2B217_KAZAF|nr:hypothetical protein KAFR_0L00600 [Kazachstania africana CBS 2517]CCF60667.1 hypothetical protein KAFR_0L00600 [Kazachstania africana CBS 2517]